MDAPRSPETSPPPRDEALEAKVEHDAHVAAPSLAAPGRLVIDVSMTAIVKVVATIAVIWLLFRLSTVLLVVAVSLMLVATFNPMVRKLQARYTRHGALTLVIVGIICLVAVPITLVFPILLSQGTSLVEHLPNYAEGLQALLARHGLHVDLHTGADQMIGSMAQGIPQLFGVLGHVVRNGIDILTVLLLTIYLLIEGPEVARSALRVLPPRHRVGVQRLCADVGLQVGAYVRGQLILSASAGLFFFVLLLVLGVPDGLALALVAAIADAIPLAGLLIALVPACLSALAISTVKAGLVAGVYLTYHQLEANLIAPRVFGNTLGLSVSIVVVAIIVGVELLGIFGAVLALPVAAAIPIVVRYLQALHEEIAAGNEQPA